MNRHISTVGILTIPRNVLAKARLATKGMTSELPLEIEEQINGKTVTIKLRGQPAAIQKASKAIEEALNEVDEVDEKEPWQS